MEKKIKHLEMIENVIERMARNCFELKGLTITLLVLIITLAGQDKKDIRLFFLLFIPIIFFGFLDSYYLQMERKFKSLYKCVAKKTEDAIDFNMDTSVDEVKEAGGKRIGFFRCLISKSVILFYCPILAVMALIIFVLKI